MSVGVNPAGPIGIPKPRSPNVARIAVDPTPRGVEVVVGWLRRRHSLERRRRRRQVLDVLLSRAFPESGRPLPLAVTGIAPCPGHPIAVRRRNTPETAHPEKVLFVIVPRPVTGNPLHVLTFGLFVRRQFLDRLWRLLRDQDPSLRLRATGGGICLMYRSAGQHFDALLRRSILRSNVGGRASGECHQCRECQKLSAGDSHRDLG